MNTQMNCVKCGTEIYSNVVHPSLMCTHCSVIQKRTDAEMLALGAIEQPTHDHLTIEEKSIIIDSVRNYLDLDDPEDLLMYEEIKRKLNAFLVDEDDL